MRNGKAIRLKTAAAKVAHQRPAGDLVFTHGKTEMVRLTVVGDILDVVTPPGLQMTTAAAAFVEAVREYLPAIPDDPNIRLITQALMALVVKHGAASADDCGWTLILPAADVATVPADAELSFQIGDGGELALGVDVPTPSSAEAQGRT